MEKLIIIRKFYPIRGDLQELFGRAQHSRFCQSRFFTSVTGEGYGCLSDHQKIYKKYL